ncbi:hypothetical protein FCJ59_31335 [Cupriavidus basilensis]|nr:hypothetical protein [Cupriavidus basilensis]
MRTWALKGQTPVIRFHCNWKHVSAIAGLSYHNCLFRIYDGAIKSAQIVEFLKALRARLKRRLMIIWDGAAQPAQRLNGRLHLAKKMRMIHPLSCPFQIGSMR